MISIRPMVATDIPAALALWQGLPGIGLRNADRPEALARYLERNPGCSFVASGEDGEIVGVSLCGHDGRRGYLHHAAVLPAYRRRGIGRRLVEHCLAALRDEGIENVVFLATDNHASFANEVFVDLFTDPTPIAREFVTGPIATNTLQVQILNFGGPAALAGFNALFNLAGVDCRNLNAYSYALVDVDATAGTAQIAFKDGSGAPVLDAISGTPCGGTVGP